MPPTFVHRPFEPKDPAFLHDERQFLKRQWGVLQVMAREREQITRDIQHARFLAAKAGIPIERELSQEDENELPREDEKMLSLVGIGDRFRRDDAAGLEVVRRLRLAHPPGVILIEEEDQPSSLIQAWSTADEAVVIDGIGSGATPGRLHRFDVTDAPLPAEIFNPSTHSAGLPEAVELARDLDQLPRRLIVYGIEGENFEAGEDLSEPVQRTVQKLVMDLYHELSGAS